MFFALFFFHLSFSVSFRKIGVKYAILYRVRDSFLFVCLCVNGRSLLCCAKGDVAMSSVLSAISLTGVHS